MEQLTFNTEKTLRQPEEGQPEEEKLTLILGDCLAALKKIPSFSVDLIAIDPSYEIGYNNLAWDAKKNLDWEALAAAMTRVLKPSGALVIFQGWSEVLNTKKHLDAFFHLNNWIIYDRIKGRGTKKNLVSTREDLLWYVKDQQRYTYNKHPSTIRKVTGGSIGKKMAAAIERCSTFGPTSFQSCLGAKREWRIPLRRRCS